jgi:hypothetical protein
MLMIRSILPGMLTRDRGAIINMDGGRPAGGSSYASSKAGLMELTEEGQRWIPQVKRRLEAGKTRRPEEIARVIAALVEEADPSMSGIYVTPDSERPFGRE